MNEPWEDDEELEEGEDLAAPVIQIQAFFCPP